MSEAINIYYMQKLWENKTDLVVCQISVILFKGNYAAYRL